MPATVANVSGELKAKIKKLYPNDLATGFEEGSLRGAFLVEKINKIGIKLYLKYLFCKEQTFMKVLIPLLVPLFFYGCFGSDNNNSSTSLSGTVADGYIENATVCFDSNGNLSM